MVESDTVYELKKENQYFPETSRITLNKNGKFEYFSWAQEYNPDKGYAINGEIKILGEYVIKEMN